MRTLLFSLLLLLSSVPAWAAVPGGFTETTYSSSALGQTTGMAWAPDGSGRLFVITKPGQVRVEANVTVRYHISPAARLPETKPPTRN